MIGICAAVFLAAVIMGAPALRGTFLAGDDIQLARDHVLVNHPSASHAVKLFGMYHRDLYQPVALLSLALDFAVVEALGLAPEGKGTPPGAWVFHLTNVLLHAVNAVLVCMLMRRVTGSVAGAAITAGIFALHPMGAETVAWASGRMMLLSTMFLLATLIAMDTWRTNDRWWRGGLVVLLAALCMMSKVRISLPVLLLVPPLFAGKMPAKKWWMLWAAASVVTCLFVVVNYQASKGMIARGEEFLHGSRAARTVLALGWYLAHAVVPTGLSPFHPAAETMTWLDQGMVRAVVVILIVAGMVIWSSRRARSGWAGMTWFLASIAVTLPLVPARNLAVAERYAYLPNIGLYWMIAALLVFLYGRARDLAGSRAARSGGGAVSAVIALALCAASWHNIGFYRDDVRRSARVAALYPDRPGVGVRYAWSLYHAGRYAEAIAAAEADLRRHGRDVASDAQQVLGMSRFRAGNLESALHCLRRAVAADKSGGLAHARLGTVLESAGRIPEAIEAYERCVELLPNYNPGLVKLAGLYRGAGRVADARNVYGQVLRNNAYDVPATLGLAEIDIDGGRYQDALARLRGLLSWMPENVAARINAGVCLASLGDRSAAVREYERALQLDPDAAIAVINMANVLLEAGFGEQARTRLEEYLWRHPAHRGVVDVATGVLLTAGDYGAAAAVLERAIEAEPGAADLLGRCAWVACRGRQWKAAADKAAQALQRDRVEPRARIVLCVTALHRGRSEEAVALARGLVNDGSLTRAEFFEALCSALETYARSRDADPWPYYVLCMACVATDRPEAARRAAGEFKQRQSDKSWHKRVDALSAGAAPGR